MIAPLLVVLAGPGLMEALGAEEFPYLVGRSVQDVTGPPMGVQMLGFVKADQISEGVHTRQFARAIVIEEASKRSRVALVVVDIAFPAHSLKLEALERIARVCGDRYREENVVISATHTHGAPGEYHQYMMGGMLEQRFCRPYFEALAEGIAQAIIAADRDLEPGKILLARGEVENAGVNRSVPAYRNNPEEERARYPFDTDKTMTQITLIDKSGPIAVMNWFAVHATSMTYNNNLITGDNKGCASYLLEHERGTRYEKPTDFVALFAQANCGDVTPNLNLDNTGPGKDEFESTYIIADRHVAVARRLMEETGEEIDGPIEARLAYVDFQGLRVDEEFTHAGGHTTCPSAFGYSFAAGSDADGGGHPLFREGMKQRNPLIDNLIQTVANPPAPSDEFRACQSPKVILFAPGLYRPPIQDQVLPIGIVQIGQLYLAVGPSEYTTMTGRRIRNDVAAALDADPKNVMIAGYSNNFAGYVTTREEYETQQYEGGHTLFGPWTEAGHRQEFARVARALKSGETVTSSARPADIRATVKDGWVEGPDENDPQEAAFGDAVVEPSESYKPGEEVVVSFWTGDPSGGYKRGERYLEIRKQTPAGKWEVVATDADWETKCRWKQIIPVDPDKPKSTAKQAFQLLPGPRPTLPDPHQVTVQWAIPTETEPGTYQVVHFGRRKKGGEIVYFEAASKPFAVQVN